MKKTLFALFAFLSIWGYAKASDVLTVADVTVPQNTSATLEVVGSFETPFKGYQFDLELDGGLTLVLNESGKPIAENGFEGTDHLISSSVVSEGHYRFVVVSTSNTPLPLDGSLLRVQVTGAEGKNVGDSFEGRISAIEFTTLQTEAQKFDDVSFNLTVGEPADLHIVLDENATEAPEAASNVDVRVKRSIKAGEWGTICLPFAMTETQVAEAFGSDVELADFTGCDVDEATGNIKVNFVPTTAIEANHPYIIKVSETVTEFTVDVVDVDPSDDLSLTFDEETTGSGRNKVTTYNSFIGNYVSGTLVPDYGLFLYDNKFYFSVGKTKMKAFRAYFDLATAGAEYADESRLKLVVGGEQTGIAEVHRQTTEGDAIYSLQGMKVEKPVKGIFVKGGKKMIVK